MFSLSQVSKQHSLRVTGPEQMFNKCCVIAKGLEINCLLKCYGAGRNGRERERERNKTLTFKGTEDYEGTLLFSRSFHWALRGQQARRCCFHWRGTDVWEHLWESAAYDGATSAVVAEMTKYTSHGSRWEKAEDRHFWSQFGMSVLLWGG